jgi:hypothetical protein
MPQCHVDPGRSWYRTDRSPASSPQVRHRSGPSTRCASRSKSTVSSICRRLKLLNYVIFIDTLTPRHCRLHAIRTSTSPQGRTQLFDVWISPHTSLLYSLPTWHRRARPDPERQHRTSGDWYPSHELAAVLVATRAIRRAMDIGNSEGMKALLIHGQQ